jgi:hypothetical protein
MCPEGDRLMLDSDWRHAYGLYALYLRDEVTPWTMVLAVSLELPMTVVLPLIGKINLVLQEYVTVEGAWPEVHDVWRQAVRSFTGDSRDEYIR